MIRPMARSGIKPGDSAFAARLSRELEGEVLFDAASRGRYSTDASIYQIEPIGVVVPRHERDVIGAIALAAEAGVALLPRGAGTSQGGQTVGEALVIDCSKYLHGVLAFDADARTVTVQPGMVLDRLNLYLAPHGLFFPVDVSPANRATIGGMTGNNSCGARSIRYGNMVHNVRAIDAVLSNGETRRFDEKPGDDTLSAEMLALALREGDEIRRRFPDLLRRVGGYNIDRIERNMAHLLVGSEGTLGFFTAITLDLQSIPRHRVMGVCHFPSFRRAMELTPAIVALSPSAVELIDPTLLALAREQAQFRAAVDRFVVGEPGALLIVEFAGDDEAEQKAGLADLVACMADSGLAGAVVESTEAAFQTAVWEVRKAGLNILMSMKGDGKPISFIEDCAVPLDDLADYTERLDGIFAKHGVAGTWYAHASVGTLHVRPVLNMKDGGDVAKMRAIAEEAFAMVREYKGSHSGEHGDGLVRSEFHEVMFGERLVRAFEAVKDAFDPAGLFNPGKIVRPERMDDRSLFRYPPGYAVTEPQETVLDWSAWGGFGGAVEMCNNNGACRKWDGGVMCPSYRATRDERHLTRGRANSLRLAISGRLGADAFTSPEMFETMALCVGCKGCKRECPTGVDMARMKIEFLHHYRKRHGLPLRERLIAYLPRYAPWAARLAPLSNIRLPVGFTNQRPLPRWRRDVYQAPEPRGQGPEVVLFADCFNRYFEPENLHAAVTVFEAAGYRVHSPDRLCCGRTFLSVGLVEEARAEARRTKAALAPFIERGVAIVGLEPACLDDEFDIHTQSFEAFVTTEDLPLEFNPLAGKRALVHGHCHQKAAGEFSLVSAALSLIPELEIETIESGCCGMAGSFGYEAEHYDIAMKMAEADLLPAVREAGPGTLLVADGISCRQQIRHGAGAEALHVARLFEMALAGG
jgi:FAD/FMN-containing dehydrogenase/Fe-S oxidoreductase